MMVGEGCTVYCPGQQATKADISVVERILEVLGICQLVPESMINAVGALAGCGPAFVSIILQCLNILHCVLEDIFDHRSYV